MFPAARPVLWCVLSVAQLLSQGAEAHCLHDAHHSVAVLARDMFDSKRAVRVEARGVDTAQGAPDAGVPSAQSTPPQSSLAMRLAEAFGFGVLATALLMGSRVWRRRPRGRRPRS